MAPAAAGHRRDAPVRFAPGCPRTERTRSRPRPRFRSTAPPNGTLPGRALYRKKRTGLVATLNGVVAESPESRVGQKRSRP
ncbi:hypothetical protein [Actinomadura sp. CNU-125]|uniref:hypothetical protein n=1 Tax=Actinomadura sp. CNU-125 TaxID=1904961 RepID=UPI0011779921|nr:hypothetical protein [Actinomadura sp. CNU-125]